ncbi:pectin acetylesterase 7-like isoform X1 [Salvia divinorum]|uniref:Pectin acetylesterase 7-like isoform X1 n=1 Tax=Salvia divinorum TaxID=28513 RepID=A0ABD1G4R1_SALDI
MAGATIAMSEPYNDPCYQQLRTIPNCFDKVLESFCFFSTMDVAIDCCKIYVSLDSGCIQRFVDEAHARKACFLYDEYIDREAEALVRICNAKI